MERQKAEYLDRVLSLLDESESYSNLDTLEDPDRLEAIEYLIARRFLETYSTEDGRIIEGHLTQTGILFKLEGGFINEFNINNQRISDEELERINKRWAIINSKWSLGISILALLASIASIIISCI